MVCPFVKKADIQKPSIERRLWVICGHFGYIIGAAAFRHKADIDKQKLVHENHLSNSLDHDIANDGIALSFCRIK